MISRSKGFKSVWLLALLLAGIAAGVSSCGKSATIPDIEEEEEPADEDEGAKLLSNVYQDVTANSGIRHTYRNGEDSCKDHYAILESLGGGVALIDYDGDGLLDVFVTGGGYYAGKDKKTIKPYPCKLYRNLGNWKFKDVTAKVGLDQIPFFSHGAAVADYDCDGYPDLLVTGYGRVALFHNEPVDPARPRGARKFRDVTEEVGLLKGGHFWSTSAGWADFDGDGYPDLYVCQYVNWSFQNNPQCPGYLEGVPRDVCPPSEFKSVAHAVYHNRKGKGRKRMFVNVAREAGLRAPRTEKDYDQLSHLSPKARNRLKKGDSERDFGKGLGVVLVDVNGDGRPDIYVANDTTDNFLYLNQSRPGKLAFEEAGLAMQVARDDSGVANGSMGVDAADYDGRGLPSLWVTTYEGELSALHRNVIEDGRQHFEYASQIARVSAVGERNVGFGTAFIDVDRDGYPDLVIINGHVIRHPAKATRRQRPVLLRNRGNGTFSNITSRGGSYFQSDHVGRGLAVGDLCNTGRPDLVISHVNDPVVVLRHTAEIGNHWLGVELVGKDHRDVVGARLTLELDGRRLTHFAKGGGSYLSSSDRRILFGLGKVQRPGLLTVAWPSGTPRQQKYRLTADCYWRLVQGQKEIPFPARGPSHQK